MQHTTTENTEVLNDLIEINNDRVEGYKKASEQVLDQELRILFSDMATQSRQLINELSEEVQNYGEKPADGTTIKGKIYRTWMDVKATFSGNDKKSTLNACEFGEDAAQKAYESALEEDDLSSEVRALIEKQKARLKVSHDRVKELRDLENDK